MLTVRVGVTELHEMFRKRIKRNLQDRIDTPLLIRRQQDVAMQHELRLACRVGFGAHRPEIAFEAVAQPRRIGRPKVSSA
jgi:hypothetical protein